MRIGLISDTHGFLDPQVTRHFAGVDHILHAGDIGGGAILMGLEVIAPVTAVLGNNDYGLPGLDCRETERIELGGGHFLVHHIVDPVAPAETLGPEWQRTGPGVVVFGHTHQVCDRVVEGVRFLNPGYAGRARFSQVRTVALLELDRKGGWRFEVRAL